MPNASRFAILLSGVLAVASCHKQPQQQPVNGQDISIEDNLTKSQVPDNTQIETLPADESSVTSSRELANGQDNPDVNGVGNSD